MTYPPSEVGIVIPYPTNLLQYLAENHLSHSQCKSLSWVRIRLSSMTHRSLPTRMLQVTPRPPCPPPPPSPIPASARFPSPVSRNAPHPIKPSTRNRHHPRTPRDREQQHTLVTPVLASTAASTGAPTVITSTAAMTTAAAQLGTTAANRPPQR